MISASLAPPLEAIRTLLATPSDHESVAIFTTVGSDGYPHAAWMGAAASEDLRHIFTLTSPDSAKIRNLACRAESEWMMVNAGQDLVLYARGPSRMVRDCALMKHAWHLFPDKSRVFFLSFFNSAPGYAVIETTIRTLEWLLPQQGIRGTLRPEELDALCPMALG